MRERCCGRFAYWRVPWGPWACTRCDRVWGWGAPLPATAAARFDEAVAELVRSIEWSEDDERLAREVIESTSGLMVAGGRTYAWAAEKS